MRLLSWNVQYGKSPNKGSDFTRTLDYIKSLGEFDVICLQELARHMPNYCTLGQADQFQLSQQSFPGYRLIWGSGFSWPSTSDNRFDRQEFGNLTLIKNDLLDYKVHQLPQPAVPGKLQMPRVAIDTCIDSSIGPLSIINTHLAFHDRNETQLQIEHLTRLEQERFAQHQSPKAAGPGCFRTGYLASARILSVKKIMVGLTHGSTTALINPTQQLAAFLTRCNGLKVGTAETISGSVMTLHPLR